MSCENDLERALNDKAAALGELNQLAEQCRKQQNELLRLAGVIESLQSQKTTLLTQFESAQVENSTLRHENEKLRNQIQNQKS
jgi:hypothetical protein